MLQVSKDILKERGNVADCKIIDMIINEDCSDDLLRKIQQKDLLPDQKIQHLESVAMILTGGLKSNEYRVVKAGLNDANCKVLPCYSRVSTRNFYYNFYLYIIKKLIILYIIYSLNKRYFIYVEFFFETFKSNLIFLLKVYFEFLFYI